MISRSRLSSALGFPAHSLGELGSCFSQVDYSGVRVPRQHFWRTMSGKHHCSEVRHHGTSERYEGMPESVVSEVTPLPFGRVDPDVRHNLRDISFGKDIVFMFC